MGDLSNPLQALYILQEQCKDDKTARKICLSILSAIQELGLDCADSLLSWYKQRYMSALESASAQGESTDRLASFLALLAAGEQIVTLLRGTQQFLAVAPKVALVFQIAEMFKLAEYRCAFFVKQRSVAFCLENALRQKLSPLKAKIGTLLGYNSGMRVRVIRPSSELSRLCPPPALCSHC